jgi:outer membrane lipoprotein-sorting protein
VRAWHWPARWLCILVAAVTIASAEDGRDDARPILDRARALDATERHWDDRRQRLTFRIHGSGRERVREMQLVEKRSADHAHLVLLRFRTPADVRNLGVLVSTGGTGGSQQWVYTPELGRTRRIAGGARSERFVGTDLTYDDLDLITALPGWDRKDAESTLRGEEAVEGEPCHVIELHPTRDDVRYRTIVLWLAKSDLLARRLEFYGDGPTPVTVETPFEGTTTDIVISDTVFDVGPSAACFTRDTLEDPDKDAAACGVTAPVAGDG